MMEFVEKYILPPAVKLGNQRHLLAVRDALIGMISVTMIGAFAVLINNLGGAFENDEGVSFYNDMMAGVFGDNWKTLGGDIWWGTFAFMTIFVIVGISHKLAKSYGDDGFEAMPVTLASYFLLLPQAAAVSVDVDGTAVAGSNWGAISWANFNTTSMFVGIIVAIVATEIFVRLSKVKYLMIKLPDGVPPAVARAFAKLFPGMLTILIFGILGLLFRLATSGADGTAASGQYFNAWLNEVLVKPMVNAADSLTFTLLIVFFVHFFWMLGLHGPNILGGVITPLVTALGNENIDLYKAGTPVSSGDYNVFAGPFLDAFVYLGGSGTTLGLVIALWVVGKSRRDMVALSLAPGLFNINEPLLFGLPIVLNPTWVIPFVATPMITATISYLSVSAGLVHPVVTTVPWVTPPIIGGYLATGGHLSGAVLAAVNLVISIVIYFPFVIVMERQFKKDQQAAQAQKG